MTATQVQAIRDTFPLVAEMAGPMTQLFYGRLFQRAPEVRRLFHGSTDVQGRKFADMLTNLVAGLPDLERQAVALRAMGHRHAGYGVAKSHYAVVGEALLWALAQTLDSEFTPGVKAAWSALITEIAAMMLAE